MIEGIGIAEDEELVSFDVTALYKSLPINRTLSVVVELLEDEETPCVTTSLSSEQLVGLLELCLRSTYFSFRGQFYQLTDGVAMGSPVSSVVANIFMMNFEKRALRLAVHFGPRLWKRYVDDVFTQLRRRSTRSVY